MIPSHAVAVATACLCAIVVHFFVHVPEHSISREQWLSLRPDCEAAPFMPDMYVIQHAVANFAATLFMGNPVLVFVANLIDEFTEQLFAPEFPNLTECWWDTVVLDLFGSNLIGCALGALVLWRRGQTWTSYPHITWAGCVWWATLRIICFVHEMIGMYIYLSGLPIVAKIIGYGCYILHMYCQFVAGYARGVSGFARARTKVYAVCVMVFVDLLVLRSVHHELGSVQKIDCTTLVFFSSILGVELSEWMQNRSKLE